MKGRRTAFAGGPPRENRRDRSAGARRRAGTHRGAHDPRTGSGANSFTWTPTIPATGRYKVHTRWVTTNEHALDAKYTVHHSGGATTVALNQRHNGGNWVPLGSFDFAPGSGHRVVLSDDTTGSNVIADAIRLVREPDASPATEIIVDNADAGAVAQGAWLSFTYSNGQSWNGTLLAKVPGTGTGTVTWTPALAEAGRWRIFARWTASADRATNAPYTIHHADGQTTVRIDQRLTGDDWVPLGVYPLVPGAGHGVVLSDDADGNVVADAVKFERLPDTSQRLVAADAIRLVANTAEDPLFVHADHLGTPRKMTDGTQAVVWDHVTRPFGETHQLLGLAENNRRFPGQYFDAETDLHYNYFRDYDPALGRYVQSDPIGLSGGLNTYGYVRGNPNSLADRYGLDPVEDIYGALPDISVGIGGYLPIEFGIGVGGSIDFLGLRDCCGPDNKVYKELYSSISYGPSFGAGVRGSGGSSGNVTVRKFGPMAACLAEPINDALENIFISGNVGPISFGGTHESGNIGLTVGAGAGFTVNVFNGELPIAHYPTNECC